MVFGAWNPRCVHQDNWEGVGGGVGGAKGGTKCFIPELLLDKDTVYVNWESAAEDAV